MTGSSESRRTFVLVGAGGHALVVRDLIRERGDELAGYVARDRSVHLHDEEWLGSDDDVRGGDDRMCFALAVGDVRLRRRLVAGYGSGHRWPTLVHSSAIVSPSVSLGAGTQVMAGVVIQAHATIGEHCIVNTHATVEHGCSLGSFTHLAGGAVLGGEVIVGEDVLIGLGAVVLPGIRIGTGATVAAGSVVSRDVAEGELVMGVPARPR